MVTSERVIGWGIVGCGWVARDYVAPGIAASSNGRLVAGCDASLANVSAIAPGEDLFRTQDLEAFLATPGLDAVYVATPNDSHRALTEAAAAAGKHVMCEKPMATRYDDAVAMVVACARAGVQYATAFDQRFQARHLLLRDLVADGALGTVTCVRLHYACWLPPDWAEDNWRVDPVRAGGGAFVDLAPHGLDLIQMLLGEPIAELHVLLQRRVFEYPVDDGAVAIARLRSGTLCTMNVAYNCPETFPRRTLEILGTRARAHATDTMGQVAGGRLRVTTEGGVTTEHEVATEDDRSPFEAGVTAFARCLLEGRPFPFSPEGDLHIARLLDLGPRGGA